MTRFQDKDGNWVYLVGGKEVSAAEYDALLNSGKGQETNALCAFPELHSDAMGVHPDRIPEAIESARRKGVPTEFDKKGCPVFTSRTHRRAYLKAYHVHDNNGGYGDG